MTFAGSIGKSVGQKVGYPLDVIIGGSVGAIIPETLDAPIITQASAASDPLMPTFTNIPSTGIYIQMQLAGSADFLTALSGEGAIRDEEEYVDMYARYEDIVFSILSNQPSGATYLRARYKRDDGLVSDWSNTINDTVIAEAASTFDSASKSTYITLSNGDLTMENTSTNVGATNGARSDNSRTGKRYFNVTIDAFPSDDIQIGVCDSSADMTAFNGPATATRCRINSAGVVSDDTNASNATGESYTAGDVVHVQFDTVAGKLWFKVNNAVSWANGDPEAGTGGDDIPSGAMFAYVFLTIKHTSTREVTISYDATAEKTASFSAFN